MPAQPSLFELGKSCFAAKDYTQALHYFKDAEQEGITLAYYFLYLHYRDGLGVLPEAERKRKLIFKK